MPVDRLSSSAVPAPLASAESTFSATGSAIGPSDDADDGSSDDGSSDGGSSDGGGSTAAPEVPAGYVLIEGDG